MQFNETQSSTHPAPVIKTVDDWWQTAAYVVPLLTDYADQFGVTRGTWAEERAYGALRAKDHATLRSMFHRLWNDLPDRRDIHTNPFGHLCDLCSEDWVFQ